MNQLMRKPDFAPSPPWPEKATASLFQPLSFLLAAGGDQRLALTRGLNVYGCKPYPDPRLFDFASSTASTISQAGFARAERARDALLHDAALTGTEHAFDAAIARARTALRRHLDIGAAEVVFTPSGTDAQLQALFLTRALFGHAPLTTIVVGSDQTGSGTAFTALGRHFGAVTSRGDAVEKNGAIAGLAENVSNVLVPFCQDGRLRTGAEMDAAIVKSVADAVATGSKVLLQIMDASKLGWRAPSAACLADIEERWPHDVRIVADACQLRLSRRRIGNYLARGYFVLITGSKFFTGPAFSGALLVPQTLACALDGLSAAPLGLARYATQFDISQRWPLLRAAFPRMPNFGQWLRWEAALEEMQAYFAVPEAYRDAVLGQFAARLPAMISSTKNLYLLTERAGEQTDAEDGEFRHPTIFSFVPHRGGEALSAEDCARSHRAMRHDLSQQAAAESAATAGQPCQVGQPVALKHRAGSAMRLCASARQVARCWSLNKESAEDAVAPVLAEAQTAIAKLDWLAGRRDLLETIA
jgi:hypothetical protein